MNQSAPRAPLRRFIARILLVPALLFLATFVVPQVSADVVVLTADRVNIRNAPSADAEVIAWFKRGDSVETRGPAKDGWMKIAWPAKVPVWAYGPLIDQTKGSVRAKEANLRNGPGKNYVEVGKLVQGDRVSVIREADGWVQIEPPASLSAFVAANFLGGTAPKSNPVVSGRSVEVLTEEVPPKAAPPAEVLRAESKNSQSTIVATSESPGQRIVAETRKVEPQPAPPVSRPVVNQEFYITPAKGASVTTAQPLIQYSSTVRNVVRVGRVGLSLDPKSPSHYELESLNKGEGVLGYLVTEDESIKFSLYRDRIVRVTAEEYLDSKSAPIATLKVKTIQGDAGR